MGLSVETLLGYFAHDDGFARRDRRPAPRRHRNGRGPVTGVTGDAHPKSRGAARRAMRKGSTIDDVAAASGVSRGTVSRVLNSGRYVSPQAREAVLDAIRRTGYVVNNSARSLVTRRSDCVGFVFCEPTEKLFEDPNFSVLIRACTQAFAEHDINMALMIAGDPDQRRRVIRSARGGFFDGLLIVSSHAGDALLDEFDSPNLPTVVCGRPVGHESAMPFVAADDLEGARTMVRYLVDSGRRRIATITGPLDTPGGTDRLESYREVLGPLASPDLVVSSPEYSHRGGAEAMALLLTQAPDLDAVFVASDLMAAGALETLRRSDRRVPDDVAVAGFDDSAIATTTEPALTTVRQPLEQVAREMVRLLLLRIEGEPAESVVLPTTLVRRGSA